MRCSRDVVRSRARRRPMCSRRSLSVRPDWSALRAATPPNITRLLQRCLEKDPKRRLRDIGDARVDFDGGAAVSTDSRARRGRLVPLWTVALPSLAAVAIVAAVMRAPPSRSSAPAWAADAATLSIEIPPATTLDPSAPALSPDGGQMAWVASGPAGRTRIWTAMLANGAPRDLGGTDGGNNPFWSADGRSIAFLVQGALKRIELSTGAIRSIASVPVVSSGGTWNGDDVIVFAARYSLLAVPAAGGSPKIVATLNREMQENQLLYPQFLPDGRHFLYAARSGRPDKSGVYVGSLDGTRVRLFSTTSFVRYVDPGYLLYVREGALVARSFASRTLTVGAETTTLVDRVVVQGASMNGGFDVSSQGVLAFFQRQILPDQLLRWFDR